MEQTSLTFGIANPLSPAVLSFLGAHGRLVTCYDQPQVSLHSEVPKFDALIVRSATRVSSSLLQCGRKGRLRVVGTATAGVDHIDLNAAAELSIPVVNSTWGNSLANAEFIIGMMITLSRNVLRYDRSMRQGIWNQELGIGPELAGKTFGTVGYGRIGSLAAEKARLLGMRVMAYDPYAPVDSFTAHSVERATLSEILKNADFLSLSLPFYSGTAKLIGAEEIKLLKPNCYVIQSSRGGIIDEDALLTALQTGAIAGASIDVFATEPHPRQEFFKLDNTILTPHIGCSSQESRVRSGMRVAEDVLRVLRGDKPIHQVTPLADESDFHRLLG